MKLPDWVDLCLISQVISPLTLSDQLDDDSEYDFCTGKVMRGHAEKKDYQPNNL